MSVNPCVFQQDLSKTLLMYTVPAVQGFFRSISLSRGNNLQDTLRYRRRVGPAGLQEQVGIGITRGVPSSCPTPRPPPAKTQVEEWPGNTLDALSSIQGLKSPQLLEATWGGLNRWHGPTSPETMGAKEQPSPTLSPWTPFYRQLSIRADSPCLSLGSSVWFLAYTVLIPLRCRIK